MMLTQVARTVLFVIIVAVVNALLDSLLYWATEEGGLTIFLWLAWQFVTLVVLLVNVPPIFAEVQSAFVRRTAVASLVIVLHVLVTYLGVTLLGNIRELFGVPI
jgi:hypothetical protein